MTSGNDATDASGQVRDGRGKYRRTTDTAEREARACELYNRGYTYRRIAAELGVDVKTAHGYVQSAMRAIIEEPAKEARDKLRARLEYLYERAAEVADREHVTVSHGKVITTRDPETGDDKPLLDDAPVLQAIDRMTRLTERLAALDGLNAPQQVTLGGEVKYTVVGVDVEQLK
jgi:DNA-binding CsgD family transcriptional regulator